MIFNHVKTSYSRPAFGRPRPKSFDTAGAYSLRSVLSPVVSNLDFQNMLSSRGYFEVSFVTSSVKFGHSKYAQ